MSVKNSVFGSQSERINFQKLCKTWGDIYKIYHNLPFLNVLDVDGLIDMSDYSNSKKVFLTKEEIDCLKKTSIDFTLCNQEDKPIICIEFDGLQDGYNIGKNYHTPENAASYKPSWRKKITELKLKVALDSLFPFFIVGSNEFNNIHPDIKLTIVDAIIGSVLSWMDARDYIYKGFNPADIGITDEEFNSLSRSKQHNIIQDWVMTVEIDSEFEKNPIIRETAKLQMELNIHSYKEEFLQDPDMTRIDNIEQRITCWKNIEKFGGRITIKTEDFGELSSTVWIPNYSIIGYSEVSTPIEVAMLLVLQRLKHMRQQKKNILK